MSRAPSPSNHPAPQASSQPTGAPQQQVSQPAAPVNAAAAAPGTAPEQRRFHDRRPDGPRKVRDGVKLSSRDKPPARNALAERWIAAIESLVPAEKMQAGLEYAKSGQIVALDVLAGEIEAQVQGSAPRPYTVRIQTTAFDEELWQRVIEAMAAEAIHAAKLLAGELPPGLDETLAALGASLVPAQGGVRASCTCAAGSSCRHIAAASWIFADQLSNDPLLIFALLGMPAERLIERLRQARAIHTHGMASAHTDADIPGAQVAAPPLESVLEDFWHGAGDPEAIDWQPPAGAVPHALLRRLGPSPMKARFPMVGLLASIYDTVAAAAKRARDADEEMRGEEVRG